MQSHPQNLFAVLVTVVIVVLALLLRARRMTVKRPLKTGSLWIMPAIFVGFAALTLAEFVPKGLDWLWIAISLALGAALGWQRGRLMKIWVDPEDGKLMTQGSGWAIVFLVALIVLRQLLRTGLAMEADTGAIDAALINDVFVVFAAGLFGTQRAEMRLRAQRLREEHASGGGAAQPR